MRKLITAVLFVILFSLKAQNLQWVNALGGVSNDAVFSVALDSSGNVYSTGYFTGVVDFDTGPGTYTLNSASTNSASIFIRKTNPNGSLLWVKQLKSVTSWTIYPVSIIIDKADNLFITGHFWDNVDFDPGPGVYILNGAYHCDFTLKLNSTGNFIWAKKMNDNCGLAFCITTDNNGYIYTGGTFSGVNDFDPGPGTYTLDGGNYYDCYISKLDTSGNFIWAVRMGGTDMEATQAIKTDAQGNIYSTGYFKSVNADFDPGSGTYSMVAPGSSEDIFISKLSAQGNFIWTRQITGPNNQTGFGLNIDRLGNIITTGLFQGISDFNPTSGSYTMSPHNSLNNNYEIFIHKIDSAGNFIWAKQIGGSDFSKGSSVTFDSLNNVLTTGYIVGTADFDPGPTVYNLTSAGGTDVFISKLDESGNFICASVVGGPGYDEAYSIQNYKTDNIYVAGIFKVVADFDPGPGVHNITSYGDNDSFIAKYYSCSLTVSEREIEQSLYFSIYPNPAYGHIMISHSPEDTKANISLLNVLGETISQVKYNSKNVLLDVSKYPKGIYFIVFENEKEFLVKKIVLE